MFRRQIVGWKAEAEITRTSYQVLGSQHLESFEELFRERVADSS